MVYQTLPAPGPNLFLPKGHEIGQYSMVISISSPYNLAETCWNIPWSEKKKPEDMVFRLRTAKLWAWRCTTGQGCFFFGSAASGRWAVFLMTAFKQVGWTWLNHQIYIYIYLFIYIYIFIFISIFIYIYKIF